MKTSFFLHLTAEGSMAYLKEDHIKWHRLVASQVTLYEIRKRAPKHNHLKGPWSKAIISISRSHLAGGDKVADILSQRLEWPVYDKELVESIAKEAKVRKRVVEWFDERRQREVQSFVRTLLDTRMLNMDRYFKHLLGVLLAIMNQGEAIIVGRGSQFLLNPQQGMRVWITAPFKWRCERLVDERALTHKEARRILAHVDDQRKAYALRYFHRDLSDPSAYDLVLNMQQWTPDQAADLILLAMESRLGARVQSAAVTQEHKVSVN
jgi:cytidylate kinase